MRTAILLAAVTAVALSACGGGDSTVVTTSPSPDGADAGTVATSNPPATAQPADPAVPNPDPVAPAQPGQPPAPTDPSQPPPPSQPAEPPPGTQPPPPTDPSVPPAPQTAMERFIAHPKALWVWFTPGLVDNDAALTQFLAWTKKWGFVDLYLFAGEPGGSFSPLRQQAAFQKAATRIHAQGGRVEWLIGAAEWAYPDQQARGTGTINDILAYQAASTGAARFDGIHMDVEPHALPEWKTARAQIEDDTIALYDAVRARLNANPGAGLALAADIPYTYYPAGGPVAGSFADRLIARLDSVSLMDYQVDAQRCIDRAAPLVQYGGTAHKPVRIGLETVAGVGDGVTFGGLGRDALFSVFNAQLDAFGGKPGFAGMAVHDERGAQAILGP